MGYPHFSNDCDEHHDLVRDFGGSPREVPGLGSLERARVHREHRPTIVCLCGSSRFKNEHAETMKTLTIAGEIVVGMGLFGHADLPNLDWSTDGTELKRSLDELHKRKIDLADYVLVLDVDGYVGESTRSEIEYAERIGRPVRYLSEGLT